MSNTDFVQILGNLSQSLASVQTLISGGGYFLGIIFVISGITKLKHLGGSQESKVVPLVLLGIGAILIFLPSTVQSLSATVFGSGNILQYIAYNPYNIYHSMGILIRTVGIIWFVRGCVLLIHGSQSHSGGKGKEAPKGFVFIFAGIFAMNFQETAGVLSYILSSFMAMTNKGNH